MKSADNISQMKESESGEPCSFAGKLKLMDYLERNKDIFDRISEQLNNAIMED